MRQFLLVAISLLLCTQTQAQTKDVWTLERCVQYALEHNISIQQDVLNERLAKLTLLQSQLAQLPSVNASSNYGSSFGRSINPTTNQFQDVSYNFLSFSGSANVLLFGWFQQRNTIAKNTFSKDAAKADLDQLRSDVSLNIATGFLRLLQAKEQVKISEKQVELSKAQLFQTQKFAEVGRLPELNVAQLESQLATDSSNLITNIANYNSSILDLKALLNLEFSTTLDILVPDINVADQVMLASMNPEYIYQEARKHYGAIRSSELKLKAAQKAKNASFAGLLPQLSAGAQVGTNWASNYQQYTQSTSLAYYTPFYDVNHQLVLQPNYLPIVSDIPFSRQLNSNLRQTVTLNLNVPIFNAWQASTAYRQAKINVQSQELNQYQTDLNLKQTVYKAYNDAISSIQKYNAAKHAADAAARALDFAKKRYDMGLTNTIEYLTTQNTNYTAESNLLSAKYDLIFKLKVIDFYLGKELKL
ncbi:MAG: TolC family protein [Bacteroidota bacterium]